MNTDATVRIYKICCFDAPDPEQIGESCSLQPWTGDLSGLRGQDDGGTEYELPEGYFIGTDETGAPAIFSESGVRCGLILHNRQPVLIDEKVRKAILLEPVKRILHMRERAGLSRAELAQELGVSVKELYEWENREKDPDPDILEAIAELLRCDPSELR